MGKYGIEIFLRTGLDRQTADLPVGQSADCSVPAEARQLPDGRAIAAIVAMFWLSLRYGFFKGHSVLPHYAAAVVVFAMAMCFPATVSRIATIGFWARISYPLYVVHARIGYSLMVLLLSFGMPAWSVIVVAFAATVLLATAVHIPVEKPSHRPGRRIAIAIRSAEVEVRQIA